MFCGKAPVFVPNPAIVMNGDRSPVPDLNDFVARLTVTGELPAAKAAGSSRLGVFWAGLLNPIAGNADAPKDTETRLQKSGRILVVDVEQIIDAAKNLDLIGDSVIGRHMDDGVSRRQQARDSEIAANVDEAASMQH